jgi:DNA-binding GntR family transcriptional regulator
MNSNSEVPQISNCTASFLFELLREHHSSIVLTTVDQAYEWLWQQQIFFPGQKARRLSDVVLASQLQLSRTPIRQALDRLAQEGLIQFSPRHGYRTQIFTAKDIEEIYDLWEVNELLALRLAIPNLKTEDLHKQLNNLHSIQDSLPGVDINHFIAADFRLHNLIINFSNNVRLKRFLITLLTQLALLNNRCIARPKNIEIILKHQENFLIALLEGKNSQAISLLSILINNSKISILGDWLQKASLSS